MVATRKLPDTKELVALTKTHSNREIAERYGVSTEAVRLQLASVGVRNGPGRISHAKFVPWKGIRADHVNHPLLKRLHSYSKREQGRPLDEAEERLLNEWIEFMEGGNPWGVAMVVHYDRTDEGGFWLSPKQPGDNEYTSA